MSARPLHPLLCAWDGEPAAHIDADAGPRPAPTPRAAGADPSAVAYDPAANRHDLAAQGWAILHAAGAWSPDLANALEPLLNQRRREAGHVGLIALEPGPPTTIAGALDWLHDVFRAAPVAERPGYVLIIGDLDAVPLAIQQVLATEVHVGRLAFDAVDDYRAYAEKIVRPATKVRADAWLYSADDGSRAIELGHRAMIRRGAPALARTAAARFDRIDVVPAAGPLQGATALAGPNALFTLTHGLAAPRRGWSDADRRARQGSLRLGDGAVLDAARAGQGAWLPGGVWIAFACFSAGTPDASVYAPLVAAQAPTLLSHLAPVPFIAATPKALLANPDGPVAFIGHVDLAWAHAFTERVAGRRRSGHTRFTEIMARLGVDPRVGPWQQGGPGRVGFAHSVLRDAVHDFDAALAARRGADDAGRWIARMDLEGFILLGDPAAHLALQNPTATPDLQTASRAALRQLADPLDAAIQAVLRDAPEAVLRALVEGGDAEPWLAKIKAHLGI